MKDDPDKDFVLSFLRSMGFHVEPIPESSYKTPDLKVMMPEGDVLVEVISKEDDKQLRDLLESSPGTPLFYNVSSAEKALRKAWHQIRDFPDRDNEDFTLIWFITRKVGGVAVLVRPHIISQLYGIENISGQKIDRTVFDFMPCYFFKESFFFKYQDIDGVVLYEDQLEGQLVELCLNHFSPRYNTFKSMKLKELFRDHFSVTDPREMEAAGKCFIADCEISRKDKNGIVRYLKDKYGLDTVTIDRFLCFNYPVDKNP
jgi:hypothetical protein